MTELVSEPNELETVARLADVAASQKLIPVNDRLTLVVHRDDQTVHEIDLGEFAEHPDRKAGHPSFTDPVSFCTYVGRHADARATTLWGNVDRGTVIAVLNDHERHEGSLADAPGWGDHRATLTLPATPDWAHWAAHDGKLLSQQAFAEHIEDGAHCIRVPEPASMLEIAQTFHARTGVDFKSSSRLTSGETQLRYEETTTATAGRSGTVEIPDLMVLGLAPFEGSPAYEVQARFRYRITNGSLTLGYRLVRPDLARRQAFVDVVTDVENETQFPVLHGAPRGA